MMKVKFYDTIDDGLLKFAVIISKHRNKWVLCKHKDRDTYECPGGHRDCGETILDTAKRELYEETGATQYTIRPICVYSVQGFDGEVDNSEETFGMLFYSEITEFDELPQGFEIVKIELFTELPDHWTYPDIQPKLIEKVINILPEI